MFRTIVTGLAILTLVSGMSVFGPPILLKFEGGRICNECRANISAYPCCRCCESCKPTCHQCSDQAENDCDQAKNDCDEAKNNCDQAENNCEDQERNYILTSTTKEVCQPRCEECQSNSNNRRNCYETNNYSESQRKNYIPTCQPCSQDCQSDKIVRGNYFETNNYSGKTEKITCQKPCAETCQIKCQEYQRDNTRSCFQGNSNCEETEKITCQKPCAETCQTRFQEYQGVNTRSCFQANRNCGKTEQMTCQKPFAETCQTRCQEYQGDNARSCFQGNSDCGKSEQMTCQKPCAETCQPKCQECQGVNTRSCFPANNNCGNQERPDCCQTCPEVCQLKCQQSRDKKQCGNKNVADCVACSEKCPFKCLTDNVVIPSCCQLDNCCGRKDSVKCILPCSEICQLCCDGKISKRCGHPDDCCGNEKKKCVSVCGEVCKIKSQECPKNSECKINIQCNDCCGEPEKVEYVRAYKETSKPSCQDNTYSDCSSASNYLCNDYCGEPENVNCGPTLKETYKTSCRDNTCSDCSSTFNNPCNAYGAVKNEKVKCLPSCTIISLIKYINRSRDSCSQYGKQSKDITIEDCDKGDCLSLAPPKYDQKSKTKKDSTDSYRHTPDDCSCGRKEKVECLPLSSERCTVKCRSDNICKDDGRNDKMVELRLGSSPFFYRSRYYYTCNTDIPISASSPPKYIYLSPLKKKYLLIDDQNCA